MTTTPDHADIVEVMARAIALSNEDDLDSIPESKSQWVQARGQFAGRTRDINEPFRWDYFDMAHAALASLAAAGFVVVPANTIAAIKSMITIEAIAPAIHDFEIEKRKQAWAKIEAMLAAASPPARQTDQS